MCCKGNTEAAVFVSNEIGLEQNGKKCKYMAMSQDQHAVQNHNMRIGNKSYEQVEHLNIWEHP